MSVVARLDRLPVGRFHWKMIGITGVAYLFNSFNVTMLAFVLAVIVTEWDLSSAEAGFVGATQVMGMALGGVGIGAFSDRFGRKTALVVTALTFGIAAALGALTDNYLVFSALRLIAGLGLGGMVPVATTLISELSPSRRRGTLVVILDMFWSFGFFFAAGVANLVIPTYGWQLAFLVGAFPALYAAYIWLAMPESPRFLIERGRHAEAEEMLHRIEASYARVLPRIADGGTAVVSAMAKAGIGDLWSKTFRKRTSNIWVVNFAMAFAYYGIFTWLPTLLVSAGYPMAQATQFLLVMGLAQIPGKLLSAFMVEWVGRKPTIVLFCSLYAITAFFLGQAGEPGAIIFWGCLLSFANAVVFSSVLAYTAESYPTRARSTGAGTASAFGRVGGVLGPLFVGFLLGTMQGSHSLIFVGFAVAMTLGAIAVAALGDETRGKTLEEIAR